MAGQGRSTEIISMIKWIRISRLSIKKFLSKTLNARVAGQALEAMNEALLNDILLHYRNPEARLPPS